MSAIPGALRRTGFAIVASMFIAAAPAAAQAGNLGLSHHRVVFDGTSRTATIYLFNRGSVPAAFRIDLIDMTMSSDGVIRPVAADAPAPEHSARDVLEFTPRRVQLGPQQSQAVRIRVRPPEASGELRSHLAITALPAVDAAPAIARLDNGVANGVAVQISTLFSVSIPIVVRTNAKAASAHIDKLQVHRSGRTSAGAMLSFELVRDGPGSVYGDVELVSGRGRDQRVLGSMRGIALYPETDHRTIQLAAPAVTPGQAARLVFSNREAPASIEVASANLIIP
jgi:P pilus assembly chaperone PapD